VSGTNKRQKEPFVHVESTRKLYKEVVSKTYTFETTFWELGVRYDYGQRIYHPDGYGVRHQQKTKGVFCPRGKYMKLYKEEVSKTYAFEILTSFKSNCIM
jgi:hypothetical protein